MVRTLYVSKVEERKKDAPSFFEIRLGGKDRLENGVDLVSSETGADEEVGGVAASRDRV
jgi:hypothetical protein